MDWLCKRQSPVSGSAGETELFAIASGTKLVVKLSAVLHWIAGIDDRFAEYYQKDLYSDSTVALRALEKQHSDGLAHVRRTAALSIAWNGQVWCPLGGPDGRSRSTEHLHHRPGADLAVDSITKAVSEEGVEKLCRAAGLVES